MLCDPCNGRLGTYEHRLVKPRKNKGQYRIWVEKYSNEVTAYLSKPMTIIKYKHK
jgi:hypothetical protein